MILNIVVDAVVRSLLAEVCGQQEAQHGLVWAAIEQNMVLYTDGGRVVGGG